MSTSYYDANADRYIEQTLNVDMSALYDKFLPLIPKGGSILDAGCGSGRDAKAFQDRGYKVTAFDASFEMCRNASQLLGKPVHQLRFQEIEWMSEYDGIWACASLLHVRSYELKMSLRRLLRALRPGGVIYLSFKQGVGERIDGQRIFLDQTDQSLRRVLNAFPAIKRVETWVTEDVRPTRADQRWLNAIATKGS